MPTFTYNGNSVETLLLNTAAGFDTLDMGFNEYLWGTLTDTLFDLSGITTILGSATYDLQHGDNTFIGSGLGDSVISYNGDDTILSGGGNDTINAGAGQDSIDAGDGDDLIIVGEQDGIIDYIQGGTGTDTVKVGWSNLEGLALGAASGIEILDVEIGISGTSGSDEFDLSGVQSYATAFEVWLGYGADLFIGAGENDSVRGDHGSDTINGGRGSDSLEGGMGDDLLRGGSGHDTLVGDEGRDTLMGGKGNDVIRLGYGVEADEISGGSGTDTVVFEGGDLAGLILDAAASVEIFDTPYGWIQGTTDDNIFDLSGIQTYTNDAIFQMDSGQDTFIGSNLAEQADGGAGADTLIGNSGDDTLLGQTGRDKIQGGAGADSIEGGSGKDAISGGTGNDFIHGGHGRDKINGQDGSDTIDGGIGNDRLTGGGSADTFQFSYDWGNDTITDFHANNKEDIDLSYNGQIFSFNDMITNHLRDNGGNAEIFVGDDTILLLGVSVSDIGVGLAYSENDFIFYEDDFIF